MSRAVDLAGQVLELVGDRAEAEVVASDGNLALTRVLSWIARAPITDGQSGYRALSADAASFSPAIFCGLMSVTRT